ncbi:uncharacterized protein RSE6_00306 [Rhynchosporium secalis]|uniref:F-box domain-containing protein n=1 Tax=Rhynchosporium secalis TaxID=38038 RepID=A0A1E1LUX5_RHYSE|nr:uncharacterized protein RSE6_00306 [Rhynchosporium secalis]
MLSHTEKSCQICAVSFSIGRVRTLHEPLEAGWDPSGSPYHLRDATSSLCSRYSSESGCQNIVVASPPNVHAESRYQHLAGPGCTFQGGYNGNRIAKMEMSGFNSARYIHRKLKDGEVEDDAKFFISLDTPVKRGNGKSSDELYGVINFEGQKYPMSGYRGEEDIAIPVHDSCWKIFERVSMKKLGRVDLDGFVALWCREAHGEGGFEDLNQDPVISTLKKKWWVHRPGTEYLVANPVEIPGLKLAMRGIYAETPKGDNEFVSKECSGPNSKRSAELQRHQHDTNPSDILPTEIKNKFYSKLSPEELANLRHSPRSLHQLLKQVFRQVIEEEYPWFWEIDEVRNEVESQYHDDFMEQYGDDLDLLEGIFPPAWFLFVKARMEKKPMDINWDQVYQQLKVMEKGFLGLRNRARIWNVAEEVVAKIEGIGKGSEAAFGGLVVYPKDMAGKDGDEKHYSCCPGGSNIQTEIGEDEDIFEKSSVEGNSRGSSEGYVSEVDSEY